MPNAAASREFTSALVCRQPLIGDEAWAIVAPLFPAAGATGRPRKWALRLLWEAVVYLLRTGCQWRALPDAFPPYSTVQRHFMFDAAVNSGVGQAGKWLQQALGPSYTGLHDGIIGKQTVMAVKGVNDLDSLISTFCARRLSTLQHLRTWNEFGKGWHARIANVQKTAIAWADADTTAPDPVELTSVGGHQKAPVPDNLTPPRLSTITTQVAAGAGTVVTVATDTAQQITPIADTFGWLKYAAGGLTLAAVVAGIILKITSDGVLKAEQGASSAEVNPDADAGLPTVKLPVPSTIAPAVAAALKGTTSTVALASAAPTPVVPPSQPFTRS